jgi:hypothetical protein
MAPKTRNTAAAIEKLSIEEKIQLLSDTDKDYLQGYIDRALEEQNTAKKRRPRPSPKE